MDAVLKYTKDPAAAIIKQRADGYKMLLPVNWTGVYSFGAK